MKLQFTNAETTEQFVAELAKLHVKLPLSLHETETGSVIDATCREIFMVDPNCEWPEAEVEQVALWIILAVNTCGGFKAVRS